MQFNNGEGASRMGDRQMNLETGGKSAVIARPFNHQQPLLEKRNRKPISLHSPDIKSKNTLICCLHLALKQETSTTISTSLEERFSPNKNKVNHCSFFK